MERRVSPIGNKYGKWIVLCDAPDRIRVSGNPAKYRRDRFVFVQCECGIKKEVSLCAILHGHSRQCRQCAEISIGLQNRVYELEQKYGSWIVLYKFKIVNNFLRCKCRCDCGIEKYVLCTFLRNGKTLKCAECNRIEDRKGEKNPQSNKTEEQVMLVKKLLGEGMRNKDVARVVNLTRLAVGSIKTGVLWPHIPWPKGAKCDVMGASCSLTCKQASDVKKYLNEGMRIKDISSKLNIKYYTVNNIKRGKAYKK